MPALLTFVDLTKTGTNNDNSVVPIHNASLVGAIAMAYEPTLNVSFTNNIASLGRWEEKSLPSQACNNDDFLQIRNYRGQL